MHGDELSVPDSMTITRLFVSALVCVLAFSGAACGGTKRSSTQIASAHDRDNDADNNDDDAHNLYYGHAPTADERAQMTGLARRYYAAAANANGGRACAMLSPLIAEMVTEEHRNNPTLRGPNCAVVLSKVFRHDHSALNQKNASLKFYAVRVKGTKGLVLLTFAGPLEVRQILERRVGSRWTIAALSDTIIE